MTPADPSRRHRRLKRRWLPWVLGFGVLLVWAVLATVLISLLRHEIGPADERREMLIDDDRLAISITVPSELVLDSISTSTRVESCPMPTYALAGDSYNGPQLWMELPPSDCRLGENDNARIGNGDHGVYRRLDDVGSALDVREVETGIGTATVFTQEYFECTNSCTTYLEPVAIIALDDPVTPEHRTLLVRGIRDGLSREDLDEILSTLEPA
jgi:hypothetical protein